MTEIATRCPALPVETGQDEVLALTEDAIRGGVSGLRPELRTLYGRAWEHAREEERMYLPFIHDRIERGSWVGCIAGALTISEYAQLLLGAGFTDIGVDLTHEMADEIFGANVRAMKP